MIYKEKILILHRNSLIQEKIASYLRENDFAVILAGNVENAYSLAKSMKPDLILWGETLSTSSKQILIKIKTTRIGSLIPVIALLPDMELFDRIEVEKYGINDVTDTLPNFAELKLKIRFLLANRNKMKMYEEEVERLQNISALQYNLIRTQEIGRVCELVGDYIFQTYQPETFVLLVFNSNTNEFEYRDTLFANQDLKNQKEAILDLSIWKNYFLSRAEIEASRIADDSILTAFNASGLKSDIFFQFPLRSSGQQIGVIITGFDNRFNLTKEKFNEISILASSLASRIYNMRSIQPQQTIKQPPRPQFKMPAVMRANEKTWIKLGKLWPMAPNT